MGHHTSPAFDLGSRNAANAAVQLLDDLFLHLDHVEVDRLCLLLHKPLDSRHLITREALPLGLEAWRVDNHAAVHQPVRMLQGVGKGDEGNLGTRAVFEIHLPT